LEKPPPLNLAPVSFVPISIPPVVPPTAVTHGHSAGQVGSKVLVSLLHPTPLSPLANKRVIPLTPAF